MRVIHIITGLRAEGAQMMLYRLLAQMPRQRFESLVISLSDSGELTEQVVALGVPVRTMRMNPGRLSLWATRRLVRAVREFQPDLLQGWMYHGNLAAQLAAALSPASVPVLWNVRGCHYTLRDEKLLTAATIWLGGKLSGLPTKIINNSAASACAHEERLGYRSDKRVLIPNGFDTKVFAPSSQERASVRAELGLNESAPLVGLVARCHPVKDHTSFLYAAARVAKRFPQVHFVLAGKGVDDTNKKLRALLEELDFVQCVHLLGERRDAPRLLAAIDVAALSSRAEGFPNVIGEAMACAVPCAVTDVGDAAWLVGDTGRVVRPGDPKALAQAIGGLLQMSQTARSELGQKARQRIIDHFSVSAVAQQYEELYEEVVAAERGRTKSKCAA